MQSRVFTSSALLREPSKVAHALNAIGLCAKVAIMFGVNPMFFVNVSRVCFEFGRHLFRRQSSNSCHCSLHK